MLLFVFASCSSDDNATTEMDNDDMLEDPVENILLLKTVTLDGETVIEYIYDTQNRISSQIELSNSKVFQYDTDGTINVEYRNAEGTFISRAKYIRESEAISKIYFYNIQDEPTGVYTFTFNGNPCGFTTQTQTFSSDELLITYEYIDENCSLVVTFPNDSQVINKVTTYTKDTMKSAFESTILPFFRKDISHNNVNVIALDIDGMSIQDLSYSSVFTYNIDNYPTRQVRTYEDGDEITYEYEYY